MKILSLIISLFLLNSVLCFGFTEEEFEREGRLRDGEAGYITIDKVSGGYLIDCSAFGETISKSSESIATSKEEVLKIVEKYLKG